MAVLWEIQRRRQDASLVDAGWSAGIGLGTLLGPLASVQLIAALGWRGAFAALAGVALVGTVAWRGRRRRALPAVGRERVPA